MGGKAKSYGQLVRETRPPDKPAKTTEDEVDLLLTAFREREQRAEAARPAQEPDRIDRLRVKTRDEFIPVFVQLMEKYTRAGVFMEMDASNFLQGGREITFEFGIKEHRIKLMGTVTSEGIAFHETRYARDVHGELISGPMLRLRSLTGKVFRDFVCERLAVLLRAAMRRR